VEDAGVKLATVATDVMGVSGREMMRALIDGVADPQVLAELAKARLRAKLPQLRKALTSRFGQHHAFLLARMLAHVEALEADIDVLSQRIAELCEPWAGHLAILDSITGVGPRAAEVILAEIGPDMTRFPTAGHLASWAGRCPGQRESAGRRGPAKPRNAIRPTGDGGASARSRCPDCAARPAWPGAAPSHAVAEWRVGRSTPPVSLPIRSRSARSAASRTSFFTRR
jgi:transposase